MLFFRIKFLAVALLALCLPLAVLSSFGQIPTSPGASSSASKTATDPLQRTTPSGCVLGFLQAAQSGDYSIAAQYLQMSPGHRQTDGEATATKLKVVMDRAFAGNLKHISTQPEGTPQEGVPLDRQNLGPMVSGDVEANLELVRVSDPNAGKVWLIASDTLVKVPELYEQVEARQVETRLPSLLVKHQLAGMPLWQWLALVLAVPIAAGAAWLLLTLLEFPIRWWARRRGQEDVSHWRSVSAPLWLIVGTIIHRIFAAYLGMPLLQRHYYTQLTAVALIIGFNWILWRIIQWFLRRVRARAVARGHGGTGSLMLLGERILKAAIFVMALFFVMSSLGFNMTTALAGVGIGGLAIGFGAQKTIENLFGGVSVLGDEVIRVGDVCRFGDRTGTVEDIGLRSTRVRTDERTLLAIPNGTVATINVENLSRRDKILFKTTLAMHTETKSDHLRIVLAEIERLLSGHPKVEKTTVRVRLTDLAATSLNAEVFCYILTRDYNEFAAVREELLLRMMELVEDAGAGLAQSSQTLYLAQDSAPQKENAADALKRITDRRNTDKPLNEDGQEQDYRKENTSVREGSRPSPTSSQIAEAKSGPRG